ncbi:MAG: NAD(P)-dependent oxidoreductase, partial [Mariprofundus sp.]
MTQTLNIVADAHIWGIESACSELAGFDVDLQLLENSHITPANLQQTDILLTRSATRVNASLLENTPVRFAATATIGDDHYDKHWLDNHNINWANAAGSSTGSVLEYMLTVLFALHQRDLISLPNCTIGIIGAGRIGSELALLCEAMGLSVLLNDPPRARVEGGSDFYSLHEILAQSDILSLHTPLIADGIDCTHHLLNQVTLEQFKGRGIINAARGACVDNHALCDWLNAQSDRFAVLDCWEFEPTPLSGLLKHPQLTIATP